MNEFLPHQPTGRVLQDSRIHPAVFGLATSRGRADRIILDLTQAAPPLAGLSVLFLDRNAENDYTREQDPRGLTGAAARSASAIRGVFALVPGIDRLAAPGMGAFIAAGPIRATLQASQKAGSPNIAITPALVALGVPPATAARYEQGIKVGGFILISVHAGSAGDLARVRAIFSASHTDQICTTAAPAAGRAGSPQAPPTSPRPDAG